MKPETHIIDYQIGTHLQMPSNLKSIRVWLYELTAQALQEKVKECSGNFIEAIEITVRNFKVKIQQKAEYNTLTHIDTCSQNQFKPLSAKFPLLKFMRVIALADNRYRPIHILINSFSKLEKIEIYHKNRIITKSQQEKNKLEAVITKEVLIKNIYAPVKLIKSVSMNVIESLQTVDQLCGSHLEQKYLGQYNKLQYWNCLELDCRMSKMQFCLLVPIRNIRFSELRILIFTGCLLTSIQSLSVLQAPFLQYLKLGKNHICYARSLTKINSKSIRHLQIEKNEFQECEKLSQGSWQHLQFFDFNSKNEQSLDEMLFQPWFDNYSQSHRFLCIQSLPFLSKINLKSHKTKIRLGAAKRINQNKIHEKVLKNRNIELIQ